MYQRKMSDKAVSLFIKINFDDFGAIFGGLDSGDLRRPMEKKMYTKRLDFVSKVSLT